MLPLVPISIQQSRFRTRAHGERDVKTALVSLTPLGTWNLKNRTDNYISKSFGANWRQLALHLFVDIHPKIAKLAPIGAN